MGLAHGTIGWADVAVPDTAVGEAFYTGLFGWTTETSTDDSTPYTMFAKDGKLVAGMGPLSPDQQAAGQPPVWTPYVIVDDIDATHDKAKELGARILMEPIQILDAGSMFFALDPVGAAIGFWQSGTHDGAQVFNEVNTMVWNDLGCRDVDAATAFYTALLRVHGVHGRGPGQRRRVGHIDDTPGSDPRPLAHLVPRRERIRCCSSDRRARGFGHEGTRRHTHGSDRDPHRSRRCSLRRHRDGTGRRPARPLTPGHVGGGS